MHFICLFREMKYRIRELNTPITAASRQDCCGRKKVWLASIRCGVYSTPYTCIKNGGHDHTATGQLPCTTQATGRTKNISLEAGG